jgi:hypothetical protein
VVSAVVSNIIDPSKPCDVGAVTCWFWICRISDCSQAPDRLPQQTLLSQAHNQALGRSMRYSVIAN